MSLKSYYEKHGACFVECIDVYATEKGLERVFNNIHAISSETLLELLKLHKKIGENEFIQNIRRSGYDNVVLVKKLLIVLKRTGAIKEENGMIEVE
ncbi:MAG: hypothetical protein QW279_11390, partial [Candidatus Jordarchaeaceae archaeon]